MTGARDTLVSPLARNYVGGEWIEPASGETYEKRNPWRPAEVVGTHAASSAEDARGAVAAAAAAFGGWATLPASHRSEFLAKAADLLEARVDVIARDMTAEMGKPVRESRLEAMRAAAILRYAVGEAWRATGEVYAPSVPDQRLYTMRRPIGVVGLITPWNFPIAIPVWKLAPALVWGNTVVLKLAYEAPRTGLHVAECLAEAGLPPGVLNVVTGAGARVGAELVRNPEVRAISFTGSDVVGKAVRDEATARDCRVDWAVLAAIGKLECDHGRLQLPGCNPPGTVNDAGATGQMQFLGPTWRRGTALGSVPSLGPPTSTTGDGYATDGDGDLIADVWNPSDAIGAAARFLRSNGAPTDYQRAIFAYNPSHEYVDRVFAKADEYRGAFAPGASGSAQAVLAWAVAHVGRFTYNLGAPTDRGGSVEDMQRREPSGSTCDCSMFARWAFAQAGIDIGLTTFTQWTANGRLASGGTPQAIPSVTRGVGAEPPPGGYQPADLIFFGVDDGPSGHVALWLGDGQIVQCSSSGGGSNIRPLAGYVAPTGWVRWRLAASG